MDNDLSSSDFINQIGEYLQMRLICSGCREQYFTLVTASAGFFEHSLWV